MEKRERGSSAVEFALVLPLLVLILFGIIEFGFALYDKAIITNASREGARAGIVLRENESGIVPVSEQEIKDIVDNYCRNLISLGTSSVTPSTTVTGDCSTVNKSVTVNVSYPYSFLVLPAFAEALVGDITLRATTVMKCENQE